MLRIHGLTVCVDYADCLAVALPRWRPWLETLTVVTAHHDTATAALAIAHDAALYITDEFYQDGAAFNKGRALESARQWAFDTQPEPAGWWLLFDADVVPPADWLPRLGVLEPGHLYGCRRYQATPDAPDDQGHPNIAQDVPGVGYFQLWHQADPVAQDRPLLDQHWAHAGNYDNALMNRWRSRGLKIRTVPFRLAHIGERENWFGRGNRAAFTAMQAERRARGGRWDHETIGGPR